MNRGKVSVCMAVYNGEKYIRGQLLSILPQLGEEDEIVISDDCSDDHTLDIVRDLHDRRIKVLHHDKQPQSFFLDYSTRNFENALRHAGGDYILLSDQDDLWLPGKVDRMVEELQSVVLTVSDCFIGDEALNIVSPSYFEKVRVHEGVWRNVIRQTLLGCCMGFRRELLSKALPFPATKVGHDLWLVMMASHYYTMSCIHEPLSVYRRHTGTVTTSGKKSPYSFWFKVGYRMYILKAYFGRICFGI